MNKIFKVNMLLNEDILNSAIRKKITTMIINKKEGVVKLNKDTLIFKKNSDNLNITFENYLDSDVLSIVDIIDVLGYKFKKNEKTLIVIY